MGDAPPELVRVADAGGLADAVAMRAVRALRDSQAEGRIAHLVLTGGTVAVRVQERLREVSAALDWSRVEIWWGDERYVASDHPDRNAVDARAALLDHVPVDPARVHEMPGMGADGPEGLVAAAASYDEEMRVRGAHEFDVVMLGVGPDGHVASLFPGHAELDVDDREAVAVTNSPKPPPLRISMTFTALNRAREVWLVVSGGSKAEAVGLALTDPPPDRHVVPAVGVRGRERTIWFLDEAAASRL